MLVELVVDAFGDSDDDDEDDVDDDGCTSVDVIFSVVVLSDCDIVVVTAPVVVDIGFCGVTFDGSDEVTTEEFIFISIDVVVGDFVAVVDAFCDSDDGGDTDDDRFTNGVDVMFSVVLLSDCNIVVVTALVVVVTFVVVAIAAEGEVAFAVAWVVEGMVAVIVVVVVEGMVAVLVVVIVEGMLVVTVLVAGEEMVVVLVAVVEGVLVVLMVCTVEGAVVVVVAVEVFPAVAVVEIAVVVVVAGVVVVVITGTKTRKLSFYARVTENKIDSVGISGARLFST